MSRKGSIRDMKCIWEFPKIRGTLSWGPITRILLCRVLY